MPQIFLIVKHSSAEGLSEVAAALDAWRNVLLQVRSQVSQKGRWSRLGAVKHCIYRLLLLLFSGVVQGLSLNCVSSPKVFSLDSTDADHSKDGYQRNANANLKRKERFEPRAKTIVQPLLA